MKDGGRINRSWRTECPKLTVLIAHQRIRPGSGYVRPYITFRSPLRNPLLKLLDFRVHQRADPRLKEFLRRHVSGEDLLQYQALFWRAGNQGRPGLAAPDHRGSGSEIQTFILPREPMAGRAVPQHDGNYVVLTQLRNRPSSIRTQRLDPKPDLFHLGR